MAMRAIILIGLIFSASGTSTVAQFVPGHIFVSDFTDKVCASEFYPDRIWEVDPETGDSWLFAELTGEWGGAPMFL
jgi:hypothetical protein